MTLFSDFLPMNGPGHSFIAARVVAVFGVPIETLLEKQLVEKGSGRQELEKGISVPALAFRVNSLSFPTPTNPPSAHLEAAPLQEVESRF